MIETEAWILRQSEASEAGLPGKLEREIYSFPEPTDEEVLAEPIYGCWEANMTHALKRHPVDVCRLRREKKVVLGNAGVLRVIQTGQAVSHLKEGDICVLIPIGQLDSFGYMIRVFGYDAAKTIGLLAKRIKLHHTQLMPIPANTRHSLRQWAGFSVRYATAWDNWKVAYGCFRLQMPQEECPTPFVCGWGGGVALAELLLAKTYGCTAAMISSNDKRLQLIRAMGIIPIDRRQFIELDYDDQKYESDHKYRGRYLSVERIFLDIIKELTGGMGVSIFIDNIGTPVLRATLKALGRQGVVTTTGWDKGSHMAFSRINECIGRHIHVHTHGSRFPDGLDGIRYAETSGWIPQVESTSYSWDNIPQLAQDFADGKLSSYFPIYQVNAM
jgi:NADPH:quinone reductase-like Zn-dependent oxidoreductase